jgi:hypothetical protein
MDPFDLSDSAIPSPERGGPKKNPAPSRELSDAAELIILSSAGEIVNSVSSTNVLTHLEKVFLESEGKRRPLDGNKIVDYPNTDIENFMKSDHSSHLIKISDFQEAIEKSKSTIKSLDETDFSGKSLWDFIPEEEKQEIENQLFRLQSPENIRESLEEDISSICGKTWLDYKVVRDGTREENFNHLEKLILGEEREKENIDSVRPNIESAADIAEMVAMEKARLVILATTCKDGTKAEKEKDAISLLGNDFSLIRSQIEHMKGCLDKDWAKSDPHIGAIIEPTSGKSLICPAILARMEDGEPSPEQIKTLESVYNSMASRRNDDMDQRDRTNETIGFALASMNILEQGKTARFANILSDIRKVSKEDPTMKNMDPEKKEKLSERLKKLGERIQKSLGWAKTPLSWTGKGIAKTVKQWPQMLGVVFLGQAKMGLKQEMSSPYGARHEHLKHIQEHGLHAIDQIT